MSQPNKLVVVWTNGDRDAAIRSCIHLIQNLKNGGARFL